jgi:hypothetical protein
MQLVFLLILFFVQHLPFLFVAQMFVVPVALALHS